MLKKIKQGGILGWNAQGNLTYRGEAITNSNVVDIVNDVLWKRKTREEPEGWDHTPPHLPSPTTINRHALDKTFHSTWDGQRRRLSGLRNVANYIRIPNNPLVTAVLKVFSV